MYRRRLSESSKAPIPSCDLLHWEQTRRLEKWKKGNKYSFVLSLTSCRIIVFLNYVFSLETTGEDNNSVQWKALSSMATAYRRDESNIYEEIDVGANSMFPRSTTCIGF